ncbi:MAG: tetratricopeptide repeat protein [Alphaproteobacteria bacterium]
MSDIFREIDDELRRENLLQLWSRYSRYIIAGIVVLALIIGGIFAWRQHLASERLAQANRFSAALALARQGKENEAAKLFAEVANNGGGYGIPAAFQHAALLAKTGDLQGAFAVYERLAASSEVGREYRDLAALLAVMHQFPDADPQTVIERLAPLTVDGNLWRATALDLTAAAKLKAGDSGGALEIYRKLADDLAVPRELRARAAEMAAVLKS